MRFIEVDYPQIMNIVKASPHAVVSHIPRSVGDRDLLIPLCADDQGIEFGIFTSGIPTCPKCIENLSSLIEQGDRLLDSTKGRHRDALKSFLTRLRTMQRELQEVAHA